MTARAEILGRIAAANAAAGIERMAPDSSLRTYRTAGTEPPGSPRVVDLFASRVADYKASVHRVDGAELPAALRELLRGVASVVLPPGLPPSWVDAATGADRRVVVDGRPELVTAAELDRIEAVVTACCVAIAETGTIVLDAAPDQGRRALTLVPDHHIAVVRSDQIVQTVPEAVAGLDATRPLTFVSGPSATSDIEFSRVEGVHGPRLLDVVIV